MLRLLQSEDVVCLQETWFSKQDLSAINSLHPDYYGVGTSSCDYSDGLVTGHPPGGLAILWKKHLQTHIKPLNTSCDWCIAIELNVDQKRFVIMNIYLPYQCVENEETYMERLGALGAYIDEINCTYVCVVGDWNANLRESSSYTFANHMLYFCEDNNLILSSKLRLPSSSYTYVSDAWSTESWLDHVVCTQDFDDIIENINIKYDITDEDHIPIELSISTQNILETSDITNEHVHQHRWDLLSEQDRVKYCNSTHHLLSKLVTPDVCFCTDTKCNIEKHKVDIERFYNDIVDCLKTAESEVFGDKKSKQYTVRPGWSEYVSSIYAESREIWKLWKDAGKPRQGQIFELHKSTKAKFKYALRTIKQNENSLRKESLAKKLSTLDFNCFWKEIRSINNVKTPLPNTIENIVGESNIVEVWKNHYKGLFNCLNQSENQNRSYNVDSNFEDIFVSDSEVESAIKSLKCNKAAGLDEISAEHLKFASKNLIEVLCKCFTSLFIHGVLPESLISVVLVPVIKDKSEKLSVKENYRPIALANVLSKVFEIVLLERISCYLNTCPNQFGFKKKHGTDDCIYVLKEVIDMYNHLNSSSFICFFDASKAFDRVNHSLLFKALTNRRVPSYIVRMLDFWYTQQNICIRWGNAFSTFFKVSNGVRQGGILSPYLFCIYVDDLSIALNQTGIGCKINNVIVNHLMYADDLVLIAPSSAGLQKLINTCELFGSSHDIMFNTKKSATMIVRSALLRKSQLPSFYLAKEAIPVVSCYKYLGHYLSDDRADDSDIKRQLRQLYIRANTIIRKFHMCTVEVKLKLFESYCSPMYTAQLWWNFARAPMKKFQIAYHNALKHLLGFCKYESTGLICTVFNIKSCSSVIRNLAYNFKTRLNCSSNFIIMNILMSDIKHLSRIRQHWSDILTAR